MKSWSLVEATSHHLVYTAVLHYATQSSWAQKVGSGYLPNCESEALVDFRPVSMSCQ